MDFTAKISNVIKICESDQNESGISTESEKDD